MVDSIKLGRVSLGEMSCGCTGCLSCRGKQSTSELLLLSSSGRSLLLLILYSILSVAGMSVGDSIRLFRLGTTVEGGLWAVDVMACHGGLGGMGIKNTMVRRLDKTEGT